MGRRSLADIACSIARTIDIVGERWTPLILRDLFVGMTRFEDLRRDLGIASNVLTARLDKLEQHGIVARHQYQSNPVRYDYQLTAKGRDLYPVIATLVAWGDTWLAGPEGPPALVVHDECGRVTAAVTVCRECGRNINADNTHSTRGPGGRPAPGTALIGKYLTENPTREPLPSRDLQKPAGRPTGIEYRSAGERQTEQRDVQHHD